MGHADTTGHSLGCRPCTFVLGAAPCTRPLLMCASQLVTWLDLPLSPSANIYQWPKRGQVPGEGLGPWTEELSSDLWLAVVGETHHPSTDELRRKAQETAWVPSGSWGAWGDQTDATWVKTPGEAPLRMDPKNKPVTAGKSGRNVTMSSQMCPVLTSLK